MIRTLFFAAVALAFATLTAATVHHLLTPVLAAVGGLR